MVDSNKVRPSTIEGIFYPSEKTLLLSRLRRLINHSRERDSEAGMTHSIIVPHAAMDYAGQIAATAYRSAVGRHIKTAVLIGPVHRESEEAFFLPQSEVFQTPLGSAAVDRADIEQLLNCSPLFRADDIPHLEEHCLEAQLPFVQHLFPAARIVPILLGKPTRTLAQLLADSLWQLYAARIDTTLFVVTANLTSSVEQRLGQEQAARVVQWITDGGWQPLIEAAEGGNISSCGAGCVAAILQINGKLGGTVTVLAQGSSLPMVKDPKKVVQYAAFILQNR